MVYRRKKEGEDNKPIFRKNKKVRKLHIQDGRTIASLSTEYGASKATISNWVHNYREECRNEYELMQEAYKLRLQLEEA